MAKKTSPKHGSMMFWPRKRAKRIAPRLRTWKRSDEPKPLGFYGYKVQMIHVLVTDNRPGSRTKGEIVSMPSTVIECPPLRLFSVRFYKQTISGLQVSKEILLTNDQRLKKKLPKTVEPKFDAINIEDYSRLRVIAYTQSHLTSRGQKHPELFELALGGSLADQLAWVKNNADKDIHVSDVLSEGDQVDVTSVSKGKGFQGVIKRFGLALKAHKSEKKKRSAGNLGPWHPARVMFTVPQAGKQGFHTRTEKNKWILKISDEDINPKGGFSHYGLIKNEYIILKGSVPGPSKRFVRFSKPKRPNNLPKEAPAIEKVIIR